MKYISLGSGSRGNATLVVDGKSAVLIDCGFTKKTLLQRFCDAGFDASLLKAIFVTHEHTDHAKGVAAVCESLSIPLYSSFGTARKMDWLHLPSWHCVRSDDVVSIENIQVHASVVPHDSQEPLQYIIENTQGIRLGIISDLGSFTPYLIDRYQKCHGLQIEANHDVELLKAGPYPPKLQNRVSGDYGHLNNEQCAEFIQRVNWSGLVNITAGHISEKNNDRHQVRSVLCNAIGCLPEQVVLLDQDVVSPWFELHDNVLQFN